MHTFKEWELRRSGTGIRIRGEMQLNDGPFGPGKMVVDKIKTVSPNGKARVFAYRNSEVVAVLL